jgi:hypothetical protein
VLIAGAQVFFLLLYFCTFVLCHCANSWRSSAFYFCILCFLHFLHFFCIFLRFCIFVLFCFVLCTFVFLYFCTFCTFVLCHLVWQSIWTSMQNLESVAQKMAELWVLLYLCTFLYFCTFFVRKWLRAVKIYLHAKFRDSSSKIDWVTSIFIFIIITKIIITIKKSQNFNFILEKKLFNKKVVFLHKNNSFFGFRPKKLYLGELWPKTQKWL